MPKRMQRGSRVIKDRQWVISKVKCRGSTSIKNINVGVFQENGFLAVQFVLYIAGKSKLNKDNDFSAVVI